MRTMLTVWVFIFSCLSFDCTTNTTDPLSDIAAAQVQSRASSEGPFDLRMLADRIGSSSPSAQPVTADNQWSASVPLVFDEKGRSNELIVRLNYDNVVRLQTLIPSLATRKSPGNVERAFLAAVRDRQGEVLSAFGEPIHARYLIESDRLSSEPGGPLSSHGMRDELSQYIVLRYQSAGVALAAQGKLKTEKSVVSVSNNSKGILSFSPNDLYLQTYAVFGGPEASPGRQWGMTAMNFVSAWDKALGFAYIGVLDGGRPGIVTQLDPGPPAHNITQNLGIILHNDINANYRSQFNLRPNNTLSYDVGMANGWHATHVSGIIAAQANNGIGVAGGCPSCSLTNFIWNDASSLLQAAQDAVNTGMQVLNWSGEYFGDSEHTLFNCTNQAATCASVQVLKDRDILLVQSAGNFMKSRPPFPSNLPASSTTIVAVGGTEINQPRLSEGQPTLGSLWVYYDPNPAILPTNGSSWAGVDGVLGPARSIVSTAPQYSPAYDYFNAPYAMCGDNVVDESRVRFPGGMSGTDGIGDGYGSCTGTSMAAPHIAALAGLIRSIDPLLSATAVRTIIQNSGNLAAQRTSQMGAGLPNALTAVNAAIAANPRKLTPLFSFYSNSRSDSFYTTIPQMAAAALTGTLKPQVACAAGTSGCTTLPTYAPFYGVGISSHGATGGAYSSFPGIPAGGIPDPTPKAEVWVFTTHENPKDASMPLVPLYRMSWKCDDSPSSAQPSICFTNKSHTDTTYTADPAGITAFQSVGYTLDGIEGYIYPKAMTQPAGTVRLMRKYNPTRDDHAIFPEPQLSSMAAQGYTVDSGSDWLGYVYANTGPVPLIQ